MNTKRIKCILTGGCRFKPGTIQCHIDENDVVTITKTCMNCGKQYTFQTKFMNLVSYADIQRMKQLEGEKR